MTTAMVAFSNMKGQKRRLKDIPIWNCMELRELDEYNRSREKQVGRYHYSQTEVVNGNTLGGDVVSETIFRHLCLLHDGIDRALRELYVISYRLSCRLAMMSAV